MQAIYKFFEVNQKFIYPESCPEEEIPVILSEPSRREFPKKGASFTFQTASLSLSSGTFTSQFMTIRSFWIVQVRSSALT